MMYHVPCATLPGHEWQLAGNFAFNNFQVDSLKLQMERVRNERNQSSDDVSEVGN